jgi:tRNA threonylcarbamoyl adenosine modification protein YeaZ
MSMLTHGDRRHKGNDGRCGRFRSDYAAGVLLALDTATPRVTVALHDGEDVVAEHASERPMRHGEELAPAIETVMREAGIVRQDLTAVAVGTGPGPFTGLRVGLVTARTLGLVLEVPVYGVCTLDVLAVEAVATGAVAAGFLVATDARRKEVYVAAYDVGRPRGGGGGGAPVSRGPPGRRRAAAALRRLAGAGRGRGAGRADRPRAALPAAPGRRRAGRPQARLVSAAGAVRDATTADLPRLAALEALLFPGDPWDEASLRAELEGPGRRLLVLEEAAPGGGRVAAYAATMVIGDVADLLRIGVDPALRRRGLARRLLAAVREHARTAGADRLMLEVSGGDPGALAFYADAGMAVLHRRPGYYRDGSDALVLALGLG